MSYKNRLRAELKKLRASSFQDRCVAEILKTLAITHGALLRLGTGLGKSIVACRVIKEMVLADTLRVPEDSLNPFPVLLIGPKKNVIQWKDLLSKMGLAKLVQVTSYGSLSGKSGAMFISCDAELAVTWNTEWLPGLVIIDESQFIRRSSSYRSKVFAALAGKAKVLLMSATPFQTVEEARVTLELCGAWRDPINYLPASKETSASIASSIAYPSSPSSLVEATMSRLRDYLATPTNLNPTRYLIEAPHARYPQKITYTVKTFELTTPQRTWYNESMVRYFEAREKAGKSGTPSDRALAMIAKNQLFRGAEVMSARSLCTRATQLIAQGFQVIIAHTHVATQEQVAWGLEKKFGFNMKAFGAINGSKTADECWDTQNRFNSGELDLITLASGAGAEGLNLAHTAEYPNGRQRAIVLPTWWSAIKLAQILGRVNRYDSITDSEVFITFPADTVFSRDVMPRVVKRLKCLKAAALAKESWMSLLDSDEVESEGEDNSNEAGEEEEVNEDATEGLEGDITVDSEIEKVGEL